MAEALFVALVLATVAALTGGGLLQWLSALAVLLSFMHAQVADRMGEKQAAMARRQALKHAQVGDPAPWVDVDFVPCWRWTARYFMAKELAWCAVFSLSRAWPALAGVAVFLAYPAWRGWWRNSGGGGGANRRPASAHLFVGALLVAMMATSTWADAPAPKPRKPRPKPSPIVEPIEFVPTDPPEPLPEEPLPAPEPSPTPRPTSIEKANARPFRVTTALGALATVTGDTGTDITPTFWIDADGPLAIGNDRSYGRLGARIGLSSSPGETFNASDVRTYRAAEVGLRLGYVVGHFRDVETTVVVEADFSSRLKGSAEVAPRVRLVRALGGGLRFDALKSNASMTLLAAFDEASATCAPPVVCTGFDSGLAFIAYGQVPIVQGAVLFTGDATLSVTPGTTWFQRRDIMRIGVVLDPVQAVKVLRGR